MRRFKSYSGDPCWLTLRYPATCARCGRKIKPGEEGFRYKSGAVYCDAPECGQQCSAEFSSAAADESFMTEEY